MHFNISYSRPGRRFVFAAGLMFAIGRLCCAQPQSADDKSAPAKTATAPPEQISSTVENSVVKIFATVRYPDYFRPWTKQAPSELTASGVVIEGKRILSNAHAVLYASQVQIQANAAGDKLSA